MCLKLMCLNSGWVKPTNWLIQKVYKEIRIKCLDEVNVDSLRCFSMCTQDSIGISVYLKDKFRNLNLGSMLKTEPRNMS